MLTHFFRRDMPGTMTPILLLSLMALLPFVSGCGFEDDESFVAEADGFILEVDGAEVYRQFQGTENGELVLNAKQKVGVELMFLDANGTEIQDVPETDDPWYQSLHELSHIGWNDLSLTDYNSDLIEIEVHQNEEDHETIFHFDVKGLKAGATEIRVEFLHGNDPDFTAGRSIPVTVR